MKSQNNIVIEKINPVPKDFPCNNCKKLFEQRWNLKRHMIVGHKKVVLGPRVRLSVYMNKCSVKKFSCSVCMKLFRRKLSLR